MMQIILSVVNFISSLIISTDGTDMSNKMIRNILADHGPFMRQCYQRELEQTNHIFNFYSKTEIFINENGNVFEAKVDPIIKNIYTKNVSACVEDELKKISFPNSVSGKRVHMKQSFNYNSLMASEIN